jgi:hypothetical protein
MMYDTIIFVNCNWVATWWYEWIVFCFQEGCEVDKNLPEANGVDNEDSINLTIGEEEENLLAEEVC